MGKHGVTPPNGSKAGFETSSHFTPEHAACANGAYAALVEVGPETGGVTILRYVIDPALVDGRVPGGLAHGLGNARHEEPVEDTDARQHPGHALVPEAEPFHVDTPRPLEGAGEGLPAVNAVGHEAAFVNRKV